GATVGRECKHGDDSGANRSVCNAYELREVWQVNYHTLARANAQGEQAGRYGIGARVQATVAPPCATAHNGQLIRRTGGAPAEHLTDRFTSPVAGAPVTFGKLRRPLLPCGDHRACLTGTDTVESIRG